MHFVRYGYKSLCIRSDHRGWTTSVRWYRAGGCRCNTSCGLWDDELVSCRVLCIISHRLECHCLIISQQSQQAEALVPCVFRRAHSLVSWAAQAGAQRRAADLGIALVVPDTSPRGLGVEGEDDQMHIGTAAGFYLDATQPKWSKYRMCAACHRICGLLHALPNSAHVGGGVILLSLQEGCSPCEPDLIAPRIMQLGLFRSKHAHSLLKEASAAT